MTEKQVEAVVTALSEYAIQVSGDCGMAFDAVQPFQASLCSALRALHVGNNNTEDRIRADYIANAVARNLSRSMIAYPQHR